MKRFVMVGVLLMLMILPVHAASIEISTPEELAAMAENPQESYILTEDIDMGGTDWKPFDFFGQLDGNGHAILNMTVNTPGETTEISFDGNQKKYDTSFAGMFCVLDKAEIKNLKLINYRSEIQWDSPVFIGSVCGYARDSVIENCDIRATLELRAHDRMFGVGGAAGYGTGDIRNCRIDVTMICVDTDDQTKDEQFMGGTYATGFMGVENCQITLDGYVSEHGYVHNGGVTGMFMQYPIGVERVANITDNHIQGKITFFEDNRDRRAYCSPVIGEQLQIYRYSIRRNTDDFKRDERREYDRELLPEMCEKPDYQTTVVPSTCDSYGYTVYECKGCGYSYTDEYTLFEHQVVDWKVAVEPTPLETGLSTGNCSLCGAEQQRVEETLPPETEPPTTQPEDTVPEPETVENEGVLLTPVWVVAGIAVAVGLVFLIIRLCKRKR